MKRENRKPKWSTKIRIFGRWSEEVSREGDSRYNETENKRKDFKIRTSIQRSNSSLERQKREREKKKFP